MLKQNTKIKRKFKNLFGLLVKKLELAEETFYGTRFLVLTLKKRIRESTVKQFFTNETEFFLFSKKISLISDDFLTRYTPRNIFFYNMCENFFLKVLEKGNVAPEKLKISIFDPYGRYTHLLKKIIFYSKDLKVISNNTKAYLKIQSSLFKEYGVSFFLNKNPNYLRESNIIFAPDKIEKTFPTKHECIVFTSESSSVPLFGTVYYDYKLPQILKLKRVLSNCFSQEYFLAALYDICKLKKFESLVPYYCSDGINTLTINDLITRISKF